MTERKLEKCLDEYYSSINKALEKACPKKKPRIKDKNNPIFFLEEGASEDRGNRSKLLIFPPLGAFTAFAARPRVL